MPRLISQRKPVKPPNGLTEDRWKYLGLNQAQPNLGPAPSDNEGYTLQTDGQGKTTWTNTLGKLQFEDSTISNTQSTDITIDNLNNGNIVLSPQTQVQIKGKAQIDGDTTIDGQILVKGDNPLGTYPVINNVLYVNENGDDANDGRAMDPSRAKRTISGAVRSPFYQNGTTIRVASGHYFEDNPIPLKASTCVIGDDLRTTFIEPLNKEDDLFHVNSGVYVAQMAFLNLKKGSVERYAPGGGGKYITGAYACAFPPKLEDPILVQYSPYIQNCTNQSGPWLFDGTMFRPNQTVQVPLGAGVATWPANTTTLTVSVNYGSVALGMAINDKANVGFENSQRLLKKNKAFLQSEVVAWVSATFPTFVYDTELCYRDVGLLIDAASGDARFGGNLRSREAGLAYWNGNYSLIQGEQTQTIAAIGRLKALAAKVIVNEVITATSQTIVGQVIDPLLTGGGIVSSRLNAAFDLISSMVSTGPDGLPDPIEQDYGLIHPSGLSPDDITPASVVINIASTSTGLANAQKLLNLNRSFIQTEVVEWVNQTYPTLNYDRDLCFRDVGLIVDAIAIDGTIGGNIQSRIAGLKYYTGNTSNIPNEIPQTVAAINYLGTLALQIIDNQEVTKLTTATQVINLALADGIDASTGISDSVDIITNIITNGTVSAPAAEYPSLDQYVVTLNSPTVGHGTSSTIYFGYTTVYPVEEKNIPSEWVTQRTLNPQGSGGGALVDGNAPSANSPIQSFVFDAFTQLNQGGIGVHVINNGYAQLVSVFTIFCDVGVLTENGGICSITNSNANFGNYSLVSKGYGKLEFNGIIWNPKFPTNVPNGEYYPLGYWPQTGKVEVYIPDLVNRPHIALIMEVVPPKTYIDYNGDRVPYVNSQGYPGYLGATQNTSTITAGAYSIDHIDTTGISVGHKLYIRDISGEESIDGIPYVPTGTTVIDVGFQSVTFDKPLNVSAGDPTNDFYFNLYFCGNAYYTVLSSEVDNTVPQKPNTSWVNGQEEETAAAIRYARDIVNQIVTNTPVETPYQTGVTQIITPEYIDGEISVPIFTEKFNIIADMIQYGQGAAPTVIRNSPLKTSTTGLLNAAKLVDDNKTFIQEEVTAFVDAELVGFNYDQAKCFRDTGLIVDSIAFDILYGGTSQSTFAGLQYWNQSTTEDVIPGELTTTTNTIKYIQDLAKKVVLNDTSGIRYQNTLSQVTALPATNAAGANIIKSDFDVIINILNSGTAGVTDLIVPNGLASTDTNVISAYNLLQANKEYLQTEAIAFVEATKNLTFSYDRVKCARDTGILVDSFITDLLFSDNGYTQSNFSGLQYWNQSGYTGSIEQELTTTTNAIEYLSMLSQEIVQNITTGTRYQSSLTQNILLPAATAVEAAYISDDFGIVTNILTTGTAGVSDLLVGNGTTVVSADAQKAYDLLQANKSYLQAETIAWVNSNTSPSFTYDQAKCYRDMGYLIDSISFDLLYGGNRQAIQSGVCYYGFDSLSSAIPGEIPQTTAAYTRLKQILPSIVQNVAITKSPKNFINQNTSLPAATGSEGTSLENMVDLVLSIINTGTSAANPLLPVSLTKSVNSDVNRAANILVANKEFIRAEIISYIDSEFSSVFTYDKVKCSRDSGIIVDSIIMDVLYPTPDNSQSNFAGLQYWNQNGYTGLIAEELTTTTNAINYISSLAQQVVLNITTGTRYQSTVTQVTNAVATEAQADYIAGEFTVITDILNGGTVGVSDLLVANSIYPSTDIDVNRAYTLLLENKEFLQSEAVAYVEATKSPGYVYDKALCGRDVGYMIDSVAFDLLHGGNRQAIQSGVSYYNFSNVSAIPNESTQTTAAFNFIKSISRQIAQNNIVTPYQSDVVQVTNLPPSTDIQGAVFGTKIDVITRIINSGTSAASPLTPISLSRTTSEPALKAAVVLNANRAFIQAETIAYLDQAFNFKYDPALCFRDIGYMVDSVSFDLLHGGNRQAIHSGVYYYGFDAASSAVEGQRIETQFAYNHIINLTNKIIAGDAVTVKYQSTVTQVSSPAASASEVVLAKEKIERIVDIIANGPDVVTSKTPIPLTASTNTNVQNAFNAVLANREFIQAETIAYVNSAFTGFSYDKVKCARDTGIIIDDLANDLLHQGSTQSTFSGLQYWKQNSYTGSIAGELTTTTAAINYIKDLAMKVVLNDTAGTRYQSTVSQVTNLTSSTTSTAAIIESEFNLITDILTNGTEGVTDLIEANGPVSNDVEVTRAYALLQANKNYLQHEAIAFVEATKTGGFEFDQDKCARDLDYILDGAFYDIALGTNYNGVTSGLAYQRGVASSEAVLENELVQTTTAIEYARDKVVALVSNNATAVTRANNSFNETLDIILNGAGSADTITFPSPTGVDPNKVNAVNQLISNTDFIKAELTAWINVQKASNISPFTSAFTYDVAKCERDIGDIVNALCYDVMYGGNFASTIAARAYFVGAVSVLPADQRAPSAAAMTRLSAIIQQIVQETSVTVSAGNALTQDTSGDPASATEATEIDNLMNIVITAITDDNLDSLPLVVYPNISWQTTGIKDALHNVTDNKKRIIKNTIDNVRIRYSSFFNYNQDHCYRDTGLIVDSIAFDMLYDGTSQSTFAGLQYWNQSSTEEIIPGELTTTTSAISYLKSQIVPIVDTAGGTTLAGKVADNFDKIIDILTNGTVGVTDAIVPNGSVSTATGVATAYAAIQSTKNTVINNTISYINAATTGTGFTYDETLCRRDLGYIVDSISFDMLHGGNRQSITSGVYYYGFNSTSTVLVNEIPQTTAAYNFIKDLVRQIVLGIKVDEPYQPYVKQVLSANTGTIAQVNTLLNNITTITNIINNGPSVAGEKTPIGLTANTSTAVQNAFDLLIANREFIQEETIAYVNAEFVGPAYDRTKCRRDTALIIDALAQDLLFDGSSQSNFSGLQYWSQDGYTGTIAGEVTTTTAAISYVSELAQKVVLNDITGLRFPSGILQKTDLPGATQAQADIIAEKFAIIVDIITNGTVGVTDRIIPNSIEPSSTEDILRAYEILKANKVFLQAQAIAYVEATKSSGFSYDTDLCYRDVGFMVDSVAFDLLYGGNRQSIQSGVYYYGFSADDSAIKNEVEQTSAAYEFIKQLASNVIRGDFIEDTYQDVVKQNLTTDVGSASDITQVSNNIDLITTIINNGPTAANEKTPISLEPSSNQSTINAARALIANKDFIVAEVIAYINYTFGGFQYNKAKCFRDIGYMVDSVSFDLLHGGNRQAIQSGVYYYTFDGDQTAIPNEVTQTTAAYEYMKTLVSSIITATPLTTVYQTATTQTLLSPATSNEVASVTANIDLINNIITQGPSVGTNRAPISLTAGNSIGIQRGYALLKANRQFIIDEITAFIDKSFVRFSYNRDKCYRDVNSILDAVIYDVLYPGNYRAVNTGNGYFSRKGRYHIVNLEENPQDPTLFIDGSTVNFYQRSYQSASGYLFEYIGAGTNYSALPQIGRKDPIQSHETVQLNNGKVFFTSTDQNGDFRIGPGLVISQATGVLYGRTFEKSLYAQMTPFILVVGS